MLEELISYCTVVCAAVYATWRLIPGALRVELAEHCASLRRRFGLADANADAVRRRTNDGGGSPCGGCSGCARNQTPRSVAIIMKKNSKDG